ncbi:hypothetical protein BP5796_03357 [Coleophoma crateriformis]|uniref:Major facilitator superfamily (MFS) profile domain-containing protein n=1 Tax=Coleophoma crateriformis TaxID=565419 RepID=A0A3D8SMV9_9HELO|nr:hypothetical protein BP5796_03357 [Coleophoma crateriformis]
MLFPALGLALKEAGRSRDADHNAAFYAFTRVIGQSTGVAIGGVVFQNQLKRKLMAYPTLASKAAEYSKDSTALVSITKSILAGSDKTALIQACSDALGIIWLAMLGWSAASSYCESFYESYSLVQEYEALQGFDGGKKRYRRLRPQQTIEVMPCRDTSAPALKESGRRKACHCRHVPSMPVGLFSACQGPVPEFKRPPLVGDFSVITR